ncbi:MAG: fumarate hydratase [Elusimicrobia bacterium]|nr:fumarate hydratase [Candidatus Liberimonas magnetica]
MRQIDSNKITQTVESLCKQANYFLGEDVWRALQDSFGKEKNESAKTILGQILENARLAKNRDIALCQDTGIAEIFLKIGQDVEITGEDLSKAVNKGVAIGYKDGYLRKSIVSDPLKRINSNDNTPAVIYTEIVPGNKLEVTLLAKGGGTENASRLVMLPPSSGLEAIKEFVLDTVKTKGINACPPLVVGIGIGGSFSSVALLSKKALLREIGRYSKDAIYAKLEDDLLKEINKTGIGPMGLGGDTTALAVHIETAPCHIASLPVAVSMQCHSLRRITEII